MHGEFQGTQASLADEMQRAVDLEMQCRVSPLLRHAQQYVLERALIRAQRIAQAREFGYRPRSLHFRAGPREIKAVDDRLVRHTGANGIILKNLCQNKVMPSPMGVVLPSTFKYPPGLKVRLGIAVELADSKNAATAAPGGTRHA